MITAHGMTAVNPFRFTIASDFVNANLRTLALAAGWNGNDKVIATINSGVKVYSTAASGTGLVVNGTFPLGVELVNNGSIYGGYGQGGAAGLAGAGGTGGAGGTALDVSVAIKVTNNGTIAGGGGGGGGGGSDYNGTASSDNFYVGGIGGNGQYALAGAVAGTQGFQPGSSVGGTGGTYGTAGANGGAGYYGSGAGGAAGKSVNGNSNITWVATGTRTGPIV